MLCHIVSQFDDSRFIRSFGVHSFVRGTPKSWDTSYPRRGMMLQRIYWQAASRHPSTCRSIFPYGKIQVSIKRDAMCDAISLEVGAALRTFGNRSLITSTKWWQFNVFQSGPRMSVATNSNELFDGNNSKGRGFLRTVLFFGNRGNLSLSYTCRSSGVDSSTLFA